MSIRCTQADHRNQQILGCCVDINCSGLSPYCNSCLPRHAQHLQKLISLELLNEWIQQRIFSAQNVQKNISECKSSFDNLLNLLNPYIIYNSEQFSEIGVSQINLMMKGLSFVESCEVQLFEQLKFAIQQIKFIIDGITKNMKNQRNQNEKCVNQFTFELMDQNTIIQKEMCYAIAFNQDNSIVLAGCEKDIKVFQYQQGKLNQIQLLSEHQDIVFTLNFMNKTNNFVSGGFENLIIIWEMIGNNQWICQFKLNAHSSCILSLLLKNTDDLIISSSQDTTIKFWMKQNLWLCYQTISDHNNEVYSLSFNEQQDKLISCSKEFILVIEECKLERKWSVSQKIYLNQYGYRLCFINNNLFTFQPFCKEQMQVYQLDMNNKDYRIAKEIAVNCGLNEDEILFPIQYLKSKCLLMNKNGKNVNLMRWKENGEFVLQQSIEFNCHDIFGQLSNNGEYLITWDRQSKQIQIRKYMEY